MRLVSQKWLDKTREAPVKRDLSLKEFIHVVSPTFQYPYWLQPLVDALERAFREPTKLIVNVPPQFGKTETILHFIANEIRSRPERTHAYASYSASLSLKKSRKCREYATAAGVTMAPAANKLEEWRTVEGGGLLATGIGGGLTGEGVDGVLVIDDPLKNMEEANSLARRNIIYDWYTSVATTRVHPTGSIILIQTRWNPDDLSGRLLAEGWESVVMHAIDPFTGESLWEEGRPLDFLKKVRNDVGPYVWGALYDQTPVSKGSKVFPHVSTCLLQDIPTSGVIQGGVDLAYTNSTRADFSAIVVLIKELRSGLTYVKDVIRRQVEAPEFVPVIRQYQDKYRCSFHWYTAGVEKGSASFLSRDGIRLTSANASKDKYTRAQPLAQEVRKGTVIVPTDAPWSQDFLKEVNGFSGRGDVHDDQVDAFVAAFDKLPSNTPGLVTSSSPRKARGLSKVF